MNKENLKVAVYLRVDDNNKSLMKKQEKIVREYCKKSGYEIALIEKDYNTKSSKSVKGGLEDLFDYLQEEPEVFTLIVKDLSVLSNDNKELYDYFTYAYDICHCNIETVENGQNVKFEVKVITGKNK